MKTLFYKPENGWAADFIPFYRDGVYYLYYLHDYRDHKGHGEGTPWYLVTTRDFVHFREYGEVLPRGGADEQDLFVFTGCVLETKEPVGGHRYHIFYTGHNHHLAEKGMPQEAVMHAVSDDLVHWEKLLEEKYFAPKDSYEPHDWRDPFVYWNEEAGEYWMLTAARKKEGPSRRRGVTALSVSSDLVNWRPAGDFYAPGRYFTHECPDYFKLGEWEYLIFSEFSDDFKTQYRMRKGPEGPWIKPPDCVFDNRALYAAKSAGEGRRFLFGWNATLSGEKDDGDWQWGSHLVVHELKQRRDGTFKCSPPRAVDRYFKKKTQLAPTVSFGSVSAEGGSITAGTQGAFSCALLAPMPESFKLELDFELAPEAEEFSVMLHACDDMEKAYYLRYEPHMGRLVFDMWPRARACRPHAAELERPARQRRGGHKLKLFVSGTQLLAYLDGETALGARMYGLTGGNLGFSVSEGRVNITRAELFTE